MPLSKLSIDLSGTWYTRQAEAILEIVKPEGAAMGVRIGLIDVSTHDRPNLRIFSFYCIRHDCFVGIDNACERCMKEDP